MNDIDIFENDSDIIDELNIKYKNDIILTEEDANNLAQNNFDWNKSILDSSKLSPEEYKILLKKLVETKRKEQIKYEFNKKY